MKFKKNGYSLIEALVVISVMVILTTGVFVNYRQGQNQMNLQRSEYKISNDLRKAQIMVGLMEKTKCCPGTPSVCVAGYNYSYGIYFDLAAANNKKYIFFADCNGDGKYVAATDFAVNTVNLEANVTLDKINNGVGSLTSLSITFFPPEPTGLLTGSDGVTFNNFTDASISIKASGSSNLKTISVNKVGRIDLD